MVQNHSTFWELFIRLSNFNDLLNNQKKSRILDYSNNLYLDCLLSNFDKLFQYQIKVMPLLVEHLSNQK